MGKNLKYGEFTFAAPKARPTSAGYKSTKGISKATYDKGHAQAMKNGGMKREPEAMVRKEVALLKKAGAPKAIIQHEVREMKAPAKTKKMSDGGAYGDDMDMVPSRPSREAREVSDPDSSSYSRSMRSPGGRFSHFEDGGKVKMQKKVGKVMSEFKAGELHSGKKGPVVKNPKQAIAIALSEGRKAKKMESGGQYAAGAVEKMRKEGDVLNQLSKKYGTATQKYQKGGSVESKLVKHANMPASKAHGPGAAARLKKAGVPVHSKVPKIGRMK